MTVIIGALCVDGVVVGADSAVTFGNRHFNSIRQKTRKISIVADRLIIAGSGYVGHNQRAVESVQRAF